MKRGVAYRGEAARRPPRLSGYAATWSAAKRLPYFWRGSVCLPSRNPPDAQTCNARRNQSQGRRFRYTQKDSAVNIISDEFLRRDAEEAKVS